MTTVPELFEVPASNRPTPDAPGRTPRKNLGRRLVIGGLAILLAGEVFAVAPYVGRTAASLQRANLWWVAVALTVELISMQSFAQMQHRMVRAAGAQASLRQILALTYAANAVSMTLPVGAAVSSGYTFRRLRALGVNVSSASFTLLSSGILSTSSFALLALIAGLSFGAAHSSPVVLLISLVLVICTVLALRWVGHRRQLIARLARRALATANRLRGRHAGVGIERVERFMDELSAIRPSRLDWALGLGFAAFSWVADSLCLIACAEAVGLHGSSLALLCTAYLAGMSVSAVSIAPGGLGVIDTAMVLTLAQGHVSLAAAAAVVVLYRLISLAFVVTIGWGVWLRGMGIPRAEFDESPVARVAAPAPALRDTRFRLLRRPPPFRAGRQRGAA